MRRNHHGMHRNRRDMRGGMMIEMLLVFPVVVFLVLATVQLTLLFRASLTLQDASYKAARVGSLNHAALAPMRTAMGESMTAVVAAESAPSRPKFANTLEAQARGDVTVVSPTRSMFAALAKPRTHLICPDKNCRDTDITSRLRETSAPVMEIPNDHLRIRSEAVVTVGKGSAALPVTVHDANWLKVRVRWCVRMDVPWVNGIIQSAVRLAGVIPASDWARCTALDLASQLNGRSHRYLPIANEGIALMQTAVRCENASCSNLAP